MPSTPKAFTITSLKGGRNGIDPPTLIPDDQVVEALNMDWYTGALGRKRPGSDIVALPGNMAVIGALFRHLPAGSDETMAEFWAVDNTPSFWRMAGGISFASVTPKDAATGTASLTRGIVFNGKLFLLYANGAGRVAVWDGTTLRRTGLAAPSAVPTATTSAGAVTDTRTYKAAVVVQSAGVVVRRSELSGASANVALATQQATVTLNGAPGEGETHWELYGASTTDGVYHFISTATIGNTQADNNVNLTGNLAPLIGTNSLIPDAVLVAKDGNSRLLFARHRTLTAQTSRVWYTPIFAVAGDDERVPTVVNQNNYFDLSPNDGDFITAIAGPLQGSMYVWKNHSTWKLTPTGDITAPYSQLQLSGTIGCVSDKSVVQATDEHGQASLNWMSQQGPYRIGAQGLQYMGRDIEDRWPLLNLTANVPCHGIFYPQLHQIWWFFTIGTNTDPTEMAVFDVILGHALLYPVGDSPPTAGVRRGWARWTGDLAGARCSVMFAASLGASMGIYQKPYVGLSADAKLLRGDSTSAKDDGGTAFQSYILTKGYQPAGKINYFEAGQPMLQAKASTGTTLELRMIPDWGGQPTRKDYQNLSAQTGESRVWVKFENSAMPRCKTMQLQLGDGSAQSVSWELDEFVLPVIALDPMT